MACGLPVTTLPDSVAVVASELPLAEQLGFRADDRLVILSSAPARTARVMEVDLPRPRSFAMLASPAYAALKEAALELLYREALAAFTASGQASDLKEAFERRHAS